MKNTIYFLVVLITVIIILNCKNIVRILDITSLGWFSFTEDVISSERAYRAERATKNKTGAIEIGIAGPWQLKDNKSILYGAELAADFINSSGGLLGRKIELVKKIDEGNTDKGELIAQELCNDLDLVAVIGHINSSVSKSTAVLYDINGVVMITPASTDTKLMPVKNHGYIFRNTPDNDEMAELITKYIQKTGHRNIVIYSNSDDYSSDMGDEIEKYLHILGVDIVERRTFDYTCNEVYFEKDFKELIKCFFNNCDSIFIIAPPEQGAMITKAARKLNIKADLFGTDTLYSGYFIEMAGKSADGIVINAPDTTIGSAAAHNHFKEIYMKKYGHEPEDNAMLGYDTLMVLANAITEAKSTVPAKIARSLRKNTYTGLFGPVRFDNNGELIQKRTTLFKVKDGKFEKVE